ncbi:MAG: substrate-binding domain-containing protein [Propionibacteriales bacterium]|nr:substrate-binding domain-containing protein [Propionibacteriales bacterium]
MSSLIRRGAITGAVAVLAISGLAACGSDDSKDSSGSGEVNAACKLDNPPKSAAQAPAEGADLGTASGKVGVILPDTTSSTRYTLYDKPLLAAAFKKAGISADIQNAQGSVSKFAQIAQNMIGDGVDVLIIDSIDAASGAAAAKDAADAGIKVIDYDRVNLGGTSPYYVSFDNEDVGRLQAQTMVDCLNAQDVKNPKVIMMNGGTDVDNNAVLFQKGAHTVLDPLKTSGALDIVGEQTVLGWKNENAPQPFSQALTAAGGEIQGVIAANDGIANAIIGGPLTDTGLVSHVVITGQDASVEGLQNVITGKQSMTIFKDVKLEATAAAQLAIALIQGKNPADVGLTLADFADPKAADHKIQALLLPAQVITQANVQDVIDSGALTAAELCKNIEADCTKLGIS